MINRTWKGILVGFVVLGGVTLALQYRSSRQLRVEIARQRDLARDRVTIEIAGPVLANEPSHREDLEPAKEYTIRMNEVAALQALVETVESTIPKNKPKAVVAPAIDWIPPAEWRNAGQDTPAAAFQTVLWAGANGDVDAMANALLLPSSTEKIVSERTGEVPLSVRLKYDSAARLVSFMTTTDITANAVLIETLLNEEAPDVASVVGRFRQSDGKFSMVAVEVQRADGAWRLVVPPEAVARYFDRLKPATLE